jgi:hypothetical protein
MKRCPTCNQTFSETWLSFCTQDGTTLIDDSVSNSAARSEPPATIMSSAPPPPVSNPLPPPANWGTPSGGLGSGQFPAPQPMQGSWQPPPPPAYAAGQQQGLAVASMICGIFTVTIGWCCYLGVISGPVAVGLGIYSLVQIKNNPDKFTGKPFALVGIITSAVYFLGLALLILIYGVAIFMQGVK